jgi:hypothetical protein
MTWPTLLSGPWVAATVSVALSTVALSTHSPARRFTLSSPEVGRCSLTLTKPVLKVRLVSALETKM